MKQENYYWKALQLRSKEKKPVNGNAGKSNLICMPYMTGKVNIGNEPVLKSFLGRVGYINEVKNKGTNV